MLIFAAVAVATVAVATVAVATVAVATVAVAAAAAAAAALHINCVTSSVPSHLPNIALQLICRCAYAACLPFLATCGQRMIELAQVCLSPLLPFLGHLTVATGPSV